MTYIGPGIHSNDEKAGVIPLNVKVDGDSWTDQSVFDFDLWPTILGLPSTGIGSSLITSAGGLNATQSVATRVCEADLIGCDCLIINAGVNDIKNDNAQGIGNITLAIEEIIACASATGTELIFFTPQPFGNFGGFAGGASAWTPFKEGLRQQLIAWLNQQSGITVFDLDAVIASDGVAIDAQYDLDGIHMNADGNAAVAQALTNFTNKF